MNLHSKQLLFALLFGQFLVWLHYQGYKVKIGEVKRTKIQALKNAITGKGIIRSLHILLLAADIELYRNGKWLKKKEDYKEAAEHWTDMHPLCRAGYFWKFRIDPFHFSITHKGRQ